ncbi:MAG TPA: DsbA family protein [Actinomycetes bacterium]|jgi:predicted DsbA family dithiol-disulfide isomerase|nr:DsbA family protein [Actinomycetes bacterium]
MSRFAITFDYLCPFARIANEVVLRALRAGAPHEVEFRAFSLSQVHLEDGEQPVWSAERPPSGVLALEWGLAVRDRLPDRFAAAHTAIFEARHGQGRDLNDPAVLREAVASAGVDPDEVEKLVDTGEPAAALAADHTWGVERHRVFGVPTFIAGDRAVFVRLMSRPDGDAAAVSTLDRVLDLVAGWPDLNEFKATRIPR